MSEERIEVSQYLEEFIELKDALAWEHELPSRVIGLVEDRINTVDMILRHEYNVDPYKRLEYDRL
jgi:hypothetical protein